MMRLTARYSQIYMIIILFTSCLVSPRVSQS